MNFKPRCPCEASGNDAGSEKLGPRKPAVMTRLIGGPGHLPQGHSAPNAPPGKGMR